ncbi:MAG TPA: Gar1/Naf1 family protein [Candidatus Nitrosocosmicus sp.]
MELLGEILHFSKSGRLIIKISNYNPSIRQGLTITDDQEKKIGRISEVIGPIGAPYASIIPHIQKRNKLKGTKVYMQERRNTNKSNYYKSKSRIKRNKK